MKTRNRTSRLAPEVSPTDHVRGSPLAQVTLIGYGDFASPDCARTYRTVKKIQAKMGARLRYVFRPFPQPGQYEHSQEAAEAAECASSQGKFWEMHDRLFERQFALDGEYLIEYAGDLGLDVVRFRKELASGLYEPRVREDFRSGVTSGVNGTPTFFINERRHDGPWEFEDLVTALEARRALA
jgi:formate-nitrite transporter family protein